MKVFITYTNNLCFVDGHQEDAPSRKITVYGDKIALLHVLDVMGQNFIITHADLVEDKKKEIDE